MTQYQITETDLIKELLPPNKRTKLETEWLDKLVGTPVQRLNDLSFNYYDQGTVAGFYSGVSTYNRGVRIYGPTKQGYQILECNTDGTTGAFDPTKWDYLLPNNIGYSERLHSRANRMEFEWALNRHFEAEFGTIFRQPNATDTVRSDIYILDNAVFTSTVFEMGPDDFTSSFMGLYDDGPWMGLDPTSYPAGTSGAFTIYYPTVMMLGYGSDIVKFIRNFADTINYSSMPYNVVGY